MTIATITDEMIKAEPKLQWFATNHLRADLRDAVIPFKNAAVWVYENLPRNPERTQALNRLIEAKDYAIRALLYSVPE